MNLDTCVTNRFGGSRRVEATETVKSADCDTDPRPVSRRIIRMPVSEPDIGRGACGDAHAMAGGERR